MKDIFLPFEQRNLPREYDKTKKVLPLSQTVNILTRTNETLYLCDICNKKIQIMIWIKTSSKELYSINSHMDTTSPMENTLVDNSRQQIILRFEWGKYKEAQFVKMLNAVYDKVVFWRKNIFLIPSGKSGKQYIEEKTRLPSKHINVRSTLKQR